LNVGKEYAAADFRWGVSDPTIVALEIISVLGTGPVCCCILKKLANDDPARHYWLTLLSMIELYGGWVQFISDGMLLVFSLLRAVIYVYVI